VIVSNKKKTFIYITVNIYDIISFEELSFQSTLIRNILFVDLYLSPDKLARKIYLFGRFYMYEPGMAIPHPCPVIYTNWF
jgi:hypothetical protein